MNEPDLANPAYLAPKVKAAKMALLVSMVNLAHPDQEVTLVKKVKLD